MKNFTNKFKQFTSRLSARWLIMALMMLVGTSSAWAATIYFDNSNTKWSKIVMCVGKGDWSQMNFSMTHVCGNIYKATVSGWGDATEISFFDGSNTSGWGSESGSISHRYGWLNVPTINNVSQLTKALSIKSGNNTGVSLANNKVYKASTSTVSIGTGNGTKTGYNLAFSVDYSDALCTTTYTVKKTESGANGGTVKLGTKTLSTTAASINSGSYDLSITAPNGYNVSKVEVSGGSLTTAGTTGSSSYTGKVNVSANTTVTVTYAKLTYSISYNANGGTGAPTADTKTYGETLTLSSTIPTRTGYTFQNWNTASNGSGTTYKSGASYTANEAATLYAQWKADTYKITYKDQGGAAFSGTHAAGAPTTHTYGAKTTLKDPTKSGYNFLGWFTKSDCSGTAVASLGATAYTADITLYAKWEKICVPETSITSAELQQNGTISLTGNFTTCGAKYHGFQWRKVGSNWCGETGYANNKESNYVTIGNTDVNGSETASFTPEEEGVTYEFRTYIVTTSPWLYSTTTKEVSTCVNVVEPAVTMSPATGVVCQGSPVTLTLTTRQSGVVYKIGNEEIFKSTTTYSFVPKTNSVTVTASHEKACDGTNNKTKTFSISIKSLPEAPVFASSSMTVCAGEPFSLPKPTNLKEGTEDCIWSVGGKTTTGSQPGISQTTVYTAVKNDGCPSPSVEFPVNVTPIPTISGATFTQPGKDNAIELTVPTGNDTKWTVNNNGDLSVATGSSTMFSAENKDTYTITADYNGCTDTHDVTVDDAFYVYFRAPKEGEETTQSKDAWYQFYYPNENSEQYRGGAMYYGESDAMPTSATLQNFNKGGKTAEIIFTDCDDYTWYGFKASAEVIAGTKYFYVHATNDKGLNGCHTHTKPQKLALTGDIYYTLGDNGSCYDGWAVNKVSAPYAGPKVHASGATALGTNKFAALYVTDCSGKEIDTYQWESCRTQAGAYADYTASVSNSGTLYTGDAGKTNNIRPETLGWYRCKVTYKDRSTATSEPVQVTGSYTHASSTLPVIIVNTNGVGFPVNNTCQTPSAHADDMKEKVSVDVKIYDGSTMVYDRKARMNYRGSSSLNFLKKSYAFCPGKDNCVEDKGRPDYVKTEKMNMLGIGEASDKDWVLYAAAADPSLMRNRLMFDTFRDMTGGWSVNSRYVELYVDGVYKGVYVMMDKITNNKKRVNITASNGFIVKFDKTDLVDRYEVDGDKKTFKSLYSGYDGESGNGMKTYDTYIDQRFEIEYPEMEDVEEDNPGMWAKTVSDIKTLFNNFESNLKAGNYAEVQKIIDYTSWADWFIISEYAKNMDAYRASCLFVYNGGKIEARPLWDQELSFNNQCANLCSTYGCNSTTGLLIENSKIYEEGCSAPFWFTGKYVGGRGTEAKDDAQFEGYLLNDPCFIAVLKERWALHTATGGALTQDIMNAKISGYEKDLGSVGTSGTPLYRERNTYWSGKSRKTIDKANSGGTCFTGETGYQDTEISTSISAMKSWITGNRRTNLGTLITNMKGSPLSISFEPQQVTTTPWEPITLQVVNTSSYDYTITYTDGELDKQSGVIINKTDDTFKINIPRPDKWGIGNEKVEGERADITYGIKATLNVADGTTVCGKSEVTPATATIILQDEPNEICPQP